MAGRTSGADSRLILWRILRWGSVVLLVIGLLIQTCQGLSSPELTGLVTWVYDGDTIKIKTAGRSYRVRLFGIDCPEKGQPYADKARRLVIRLARKKVVTIRTKDQDSYGRLVGWVLLPDGRNLNKELVKAGLAWHYRRYSDDPDLARLEKKARQLRKGLWRDPRPVAPWDYKQP